MLYKHRNTNVQRKGQTYLTGKTPKLEMTLPTRTSEPKLAVVTRQAIRKTHTNDERYMK